MVTTNGTGSDDVFSGANDDDVLKAMDGNDRISGEGVTIK